jgi:hypothetical protein
VGNQGKQQEFLYAHRVVTKIVDAYLSNFVGASQHAECRGLLKEYAGGYLETCGSGADGFGRLSSRARASKPHNPHAYIQFYSWAKQEFSSAIVGLGLEQRKRVAVIPSGIVVVCVICSSRRRLCCRVLSRDMSWCGDNLRHVLG